MSMKKRIHIYRKKYQYREFIEIMSPFESPYLSLMVPRRCREPLVHEANFLYGLRTISAPTAPQGNSAFESGRESEIEGGREKGGWRGRGLVRLRQSIVLPFIRRHVTNPVDPFRSSRLVTLSSASSALGILNLITNCPNARHTVPPPPSSATLLRLGRFLSLTPSSYSLCPHSLILPFLPSISCSVSRSLARDSDEKTLVARSELLAGRLYLQHSFSGKSRRNPSPSPDVRPFFSHHLFPFLIALIAYLFCILAILPFINVIKISYIADGFYRHFLSI